MILHLPSSLCYLQNVDALFFSPQKCSSSEPQILCLIFLSDLIQHPPFILMSNSSSVQLSFFEMLSPLYGMTFPFFSLLPNGFFLPLAFHQEAPQQHRGKPVKFGSFKNTYILMGIFPKWTGNSLRAGPCLTVLMELL